MSAVKKAVGGVTDFLTGGETTKDTAYTSRTPEEQARLKAVQENLNKLYGDTTNQTGFETQNAQNSASDFQNMLASFVAGGSQNPNPTPEQLQQATQYVDQTFTTPAQTQLNQYAGDFASQQNAKAAAMGRNPNLDIATQQGVGGEIARQGIGLQAERGSRIASTAQGLNDTAYNRNLGTLNASASGSNFLNSLAQQAFNNKLSLLNGQTGLAQMDQAERKVGQFGTSSGLLSNIGSVASGAASAGSSINSLSNMFNK